MDKLYILRGNLHKNAILALYLLFAHSKKTGGVKCSRKRDIMRKAPVYESFGFLLQKSKWNTICVQVKVYRLNNKGVFYFTKHAYSFTRQISCAICRHKTRFRRAHRPACAFHCGPLRVASRPPWPRRIQPGCLYE